MLCFFLKGYYIININIQFMRAIAAIMVLLFHTAGHYYAVGGSSHEINLFSIFENFGYIGVDIFFIISGYIMWYTTSTLKYGDKKNVFSFLYNRFTRIYLGYWVFFITLLVGYKFLGKNLEHIDLLSSFFLITNKIDRLLIPVSWTLTYEMYFYVFFSILLFYNKNLRIKIINLIILLIITIQFFIFKFWSNFESLGLFKFFLSPLCLEFLIGIKIANFFENNRISRVKYIFFLALLFFLMGILYQNYIVCHTLAGGYTLHERVLFFGTFSALIILALTELHMRGISILPKFSLLVGDASYSLYLSHTIILLGLYFIGIRDKIKEFGSYQELFMVLIVLFIIAYSVIHYRYIEKPLISFARKFKKKVI